MGEKRVEAWVSLAVHGRVRGLAEAAGLSVSEWLADLVAKEVRVDGDGGDGPRFGVPVAPVGGGVGVVSRRDGSASVGVGAGDERPLVDWDALLAKGRESKALVMGRTSLYLEPDPIEEIA